MLDSHSRDQKENGQFGHLNIHALEKFSAYGVTIQRIWNMEHKSNVYVRGKAEIILKGDIMKHFHTSKCLLETESGGVLFPL